MATATTSFASTKSQKKELCSFCKEKPFDLICSCGDKFDFTCIHQHVEMIGAEFHNLYHEAGIQLTKFKDFKGQNDDQTQKARSVIENWKHKRLQDLNDIADKAIQHLTSQINANENISKFEEIYEDLGKQLDHIVHDTLDTVVELNRQLKANLENSSDLSSSKNGIDDSSLDTELQAKLNPSTNLINSDRRARSTSSSSSIVNRKTVIPKTPSVEQPRSRSPSDERRSRSPSNERRSRSPSNERRSPSPSNEHRVPSASVEAPVVSTSTSYVDNEPHRRDRSESPRRSRSPSREDERAKDKQPYGTTDLNDGTTESMSQDEFDAGQTRHIDRQNVTILDVSNDKFAATVCSHNNQLIYNNFDKTTQLLQLKFVRNVRNPTVDEPIEWSVLDTATVDDDEWVQDIIYSNKLHGYLLLNRARLRLLPNNTTQLKEFHVFNQRRMKRLSANDQFIYLTSSSVNVPSQGDEIILLNYDKNEQVCKTFRDIIPSRINRGAGPACGEISDIAVSETNQVIIGYRLERRNEVGVCLFNVTNDGREWSCVKQLLLNDCWHSDSSFTPRIDWSERLQNFLLIEYITGHLIMIDNTGQVAGECRFMHPRNRQESAINLSISNNGLLCVRYQSSITIHKLK